MRRMLLVHICHSPACLTLMLGCVSRSFAQPTCGNTDLSRPGPKPFQCPAGKVPVPGSATTTDPSESVCCQVTRHSQIFKAASHP
jgi:hypothetical protein